MEGAAGEETGVDKAEASSSSSSSKLRQDEKQNKRKHHQMGGDSARDGDGNGDSDHSDVSKNSRNRSIRKSKRRDRKRRKNKEKQSKRVAERQKASSPCRHTSRRRRRGRSRCFSHSRSRSRCRSRSKDCQERRRLRKRSIRKNRKYDSKRPPSLSPSRSSSSSPPSSSSSLSRSSTSSSTNNQRKCRNRSQRRRKASRKQTRRRLRRSRSRSSRDSRRSSSSSSSSLSPSSSVRRRLRKGRKRRRRNSQSVRDRRHRFSHSHSRRRQGRRRSPDYRSNLYATDKRKRTRRRERSSSRKRRHDQDEDRPSEDRHKRYLQNDTAHGRRNYRHRRRPLGYKNDDHSPSASSSSSSSRSSSSPTRRDNRRRRGSSSHSRRARNYRNGRSNAGVVSDDDEFGYRGTFDDARRNRSARTEHDQLDHNHLSYSNHNHWDDHSHHQEQDGNHNQQLERNSAAEGHFEGREGSVIGNFRVLREVGKGTFGRVVECLDIRHDQRRNNNSVVAIKVVRNVKRYHDSALIEADIVRGVNRRGGRGVSHIAVMYDTFSYQGHFCMVFEALGPSLYEFLKNKMDFHPFPSDYVRSFARQLLETVEFLHSFGLIHTDLKPENVLLLDANERNHRGRTIPASSRVKIIDFGGATYDDEKKSHVVNTRQYRAPEVILGTGWSMPSDIWSIGCILSELYLGELLFATHDNVEHLALIEIIIGRFPPRMLDWAENRDLVQESFGSNGDHRMGEVLNDESLEFVRETPSLDAMIRRKDSDLLRLLRNILVIDPEHRATAKECLRHFGHGE